MKRWWIGVAGSLTLATGSLAAQPSEISRAMEDVMARMHSAMMVAPTRSADHDFARMMIAHHLGAIEMAVYAVPQVLAADRCFERPSGRGDQARARVDVRWSAL